MGGPPQRRQSPHLQPGDAQRGIRCRSLGHSGEATLVVFLPITALSSRALLCMPCGACRDCGLWKPSCPTAV